MTLYDRYQDEKQFRDQFIKPLLNRLGFHGVAEQHGSQEFGKDFVFSELHRLGGIRHYAAQVKHEKKIHQGLPVRELLAQIKQAFTNPFKRADSPRECHVCSVYVFNSGEITANATQEMLNDLLTEKYGDNVHFLDGERLQQLNEYVVVRNDEDARLRLGALKAQLELNIWLWSQGGVEITHSATGPVQKEILDGRASLLDGIEQYLSKPVPGDPIDMKAIGDLWLGIRMLDADRMRAYLGLGSGMQRSTDIHTVRVVAQQVTKDAREIISQIETALQSKFQPIK